MGSGIIKFSLAQLRFALVKNSCFRGQDLQALEHTQQLTSQVTVGSGFPSRTEFPLDCSQNLFSFSSVNSLVY